MVNMFHHICYAFRSLLSSSTGMTKRASMGFSYPSGGTLSLPQAQG